MPSFSVDINTQLVQDDEFENLSFQIIKPIFSLLL